MRAGRQLGARPGPGEDRGAVLIPLYRVTYLIFDNVIIQTLLVIQRTQVALVYCYAFEDGYAVILVIKLTWLD
jgi:hypothetical protein